MTDYTLHISSYRGWVPGAVHFTGRVEGPHIQPCCPGGSTFHGSEGPLHGKTTCRQGHVLPDRVRWDVEQAWTTERMDRWAASKFEGPGPRQFATPEDVIECARGRFLGTLPVRRYHDDDVVAGSPGDRLFAGHVSSSADDIDGIWGTCIAEVPAEPGGAVPADTGTVTAGVTASREQRLRAVTEGIAAAQQAPADQDWMEEIRDDG